MKKFLCSIVVLASLFGARAFGQLPNMSIVSHAGHIAAKVQVVRTLNNTDNYGGTNYIVAGPINATIGGGHGNVDTNKTAEEWVNGGGGAHTSESRAKITFTQSQELTSGYSPDDGHALTILHKQFLEMPASSVGSLYSGRGTAATGGWHTRIVRPGDPGSWTTQDVGCNFKLTGNPRTLTASSTLSRSDATEVFLKATWGENYMIARYDQTQEAWEITYSCKWLPNGSVESDVLWTLSEDLDIDVNVYQTITPYSYEVCKVEVSDNPTLDGSDLISTTQQNRLYQNAASHLGSGGGAGTTTVESNAKVEAILLVNIKEDI